MNPFPSKKIYLLIGPKGSGKSYIGTIMQSELGIAFIRVEDWAKQVKKDRAVDNEAYLEEVFTTIGKELIKCLNEKDQVVFESTGLTQYFDQMLDRLRKHCPVITIGIHAGSDTCLSRVRSRDQSIHINVSDNQVEMINKKVRERCFPADFHIDNENIERDILISELKAIIEAKHFQ